LAAEWWPPPIHHATTETHAQQKTPCTNILVDPMAGSGSLVLEAAMMAADLAPALMRIRCNMPGSANPPMVRWNQQQQHHNNNNNNNSKKRGTAMDHWRQALNEARRRAKVGVRALHDSTTLQIHANDVHAGSVNLLRQSLDAAGLAHVVQVHQHDCRDWQPDFFPPLDSSSSTPSVTVVTNPPWGIRLTDDMHESWEALRTFVRTTCPKGSTVWVLSGNPAATKHLGLRKSQSVVIKTGEQDLRWIQYVLHGGLPPLPPPAASTTTTRDTIILARYDDTKKPAKRHVTKGSKAVVRLPVENEWLS
jgi:putative N6-adenine-specific DNA methylase